MVLPSHINTRESECFVETTGGDVAKRVVIAEGNVTATFGGAQNVKITNLAIANPATEYSHALTSGTKKLIIRARGITKTQYAFTNGQSGSTYCTIPRGATETLNDLDFTGKTLYAQCSSTDVLEIKEFY